MPDPEEDTEDPTANPDAEAGEEEDDSSLSDLPKAVRERLALQDIRRHPAVEGRAVGGRRVSGCVSPAG